jgi:hypothetical protein
MKNIFSYRHFIFLLFLSACISSKSSKISKEPSETVELIIIPYAGEKPLYMDSLYQSPAGQIYSVKKLSFFINDIALSGSSGKEYAVKSENNQTGVFLLNFTKPDFDAGYGIQSCKIFFKAKPGDYSDIRFTFGVPRELNHSDPAVAPSPLNLAQAAEMYWEWNSGYIFFLAEGKIYNQENKLFHFALGNDSRIMPFSFGNLFEVSPLIKVQKGKTTRIKFALDLNKLLVNGDKTTYTLNSSAQTIVHGGYYADILRNNLIHSVKFISADIIESKRE